MQFAGMVRAFEGEQAGLQCDEGRSAIRDHCGSEDSTGVRVQAARYV